MAKIMKRCSKCGIEKPLSDYGKNSRSKDGLRPNCKACKKIQRKKEYQANPGRFRAAAKRWGENNPEKKSAAGKRWYAENKGRHKATGLAWIAVPENRERAMLSTFESGLRRKYGVSPDEYYSKLSAQGGKCAIKSCNNPSSKRLSVDHNHSTGEVRGLLCTNCNAALGLVDDNQGILADLIDYLNMYDGTSHGGFVASIYKSDQLN